jgi:hypothetical protein
LKYSVDVKYKYEKRIYDHFILQKSH